MLIDNARGKERGLIATQNGAALYHSKVYEHIRSFSSTGYPKEIIAYRNKNLLTMVLSTEKTKRTYKN